MQLSIDEDLTYLFSRRFRRYADLSLVEKNLYDGITILPVGIKLFMNRELEYVYYTNGLIVNQVSLKYWTQPYHTIFFD